jgi:hypothetical protein
MLTLLIFSINITLTVPKTPPPLPPPRQGRRTEFHTLQRNSTENSKQIFREEELLDLRPNFHIQVSVRDLYIPTFWSAYSARGKYVVRSLEHKCGNWA